METEITTTQAPEMTPVTTVDGKEPEMTTETMLAPTSEEAPAVVSEVALKKPTKPAKASAKAARALKVLCKADGCKTEITPQNEQGYCSVHWPESKLAQARMAERQAAMIMAPQTSRGRWSSADEMLKLEDAPKIAGREPTGVVVEFLEHVLKVRDAALKSHFDGRTSFPWVGAIEVVYEELDAQAARRQGGQKDALALLPGWLGRKQNPRSHWGGRYRLLADQMVIVLGAALLTPKRSVGRPRIETPPPAPAKPAAKPTTANKTRAKAS